MEISRGELRIQPHRLLEFADSIGGHEAALEVQSGLVMAVSLEIRGGGLLDGRSLSGTARQELPGDAHGERVYHAEDVLDALAFELRSEEHTSELQSHLNLVCRLL